MVGPSSYSPQISNHPCSGAAYRLAEQFVGTWQEYTVTEGGEVVVGTLTTSFELDGCVISQRFLSVDGEFAFISFGYVEQDRGQWYETYVFSDGRAASYRWREEGPDIITDRVGGGPDDLRRLRIRFVSADVYEVREERSSDGGESWHEVELTVTRRLL